MRTPRQAATARKRSSPSRPATEAASQDPCDRDLLVNRPEHPTLRANSYPEVSNLFCRLPLPILPSTRGCSPWRPAAVMGTTRRENPSVRAENTPLDFQGPLTAHRTPQRCDALPAERPLLRLTRFRGPPLSQGCEGEERTPPGASTGVSRFI
jgi:hypothetical protein